MMIPSSKTNLVTIVKLKDASANGLPATKYLDPEVSGGVRGLKSTEVTLGQKGFLPGGISRPAGAITSPG